MFYLYIIYGIAKHYVYVNIVCIFFNRIIPHAGPLTYTDNDGKTTVYGVVSGAGSLTKNKCKSVALFSRVSHPKILKWIKNMF